SSRPGRPVELRAGGKVAELTIVDPTGKQFAVRRSEGDVFQFQDTNRLGVYDVRRGDQVIERFAVNLFDQQESDVDVRPSQDKKGTTVNPADIRIGNVDVAATVGQTPTRIEAWKPVLACALFVLILEWYIYNRRVYLCNAEKYGNETKKTRHRRAEPDRSKRFYSSRFGRRISR